MKQLKKLGNDIYKMLPSRFILKAGDVVIVRWGHYRVEATVEGFYCYGIKLEKMGVFPFNTGRFYSCGYGGEDPVFITKKDWHYFPAVVCEWLRLKLPQKVGARIFGF